MSGSASGPITNGLHTYETSDMSVVTIETDAGITGYGVGRPRPGEKEFRAQFLRPLVGKDPTMTEAIWSSLWSPKMSGRRGYETRALSSIDIALWDIKAKLARYAALQDARRLSATNIPIYIAGGYYATGKGHSELQEEMASYVALGARAVKMKVGAAADQGRHRPHQGGARSHRPRCRPAARRQLRLSRL